MNQNSRFLNPRETNKRWAAVLAIVLLVTGLAWVWMGVRSNSNSNSTSDDAGSPGTVLKQTAPDNPPRGVNSGPQEVIESPATAPRRGKPPPRNPAARAALALVGKDPAAELVWHEAINNPDLPDQERQDLIEDLNEDGFTNPKRPTAADLPLIRARLEIIDRLMPEAMDGTNLDAFGEARKDLINLEIKLSRQ